ncbi:MAG: tRNA (guanosine(46)-N7)-methyltransferase TrmB [Ruminococcus sp.]|nr:tRNA (guanosine(46)-N7)-methyltransferase TrmB [Ruminococcus sp.]
MRIRHKPWAKPELEVCPFYIANPTQCCGRWKEMFSTEKPLRLELGCGKGGFLAQEAPANPDYHYIAIDIKNEMLVLAKRKLENAYAEQERTPENVRICIWNISYLQEIFSPKDRIDRIYINFCNPWSHNKHKKRRLTHPRQLAQYRTILDGEIWFKTDDAGLFADSIRYFKETGFSIRTLTDDLHADQNLRYFETEHEQMFDEMGKRIHFLIAEPNPTVSMESFQELLHQSERNR